MITSFQSLLTNDWVAVPTESPGHLVVFGRVLIRALLLVDKAGVLVSLAARPVMLQDFLQKRISNDVWSVNKGRK